MVMNNKLKYFGKIIEKGYCPVSSNRGTVTFFENRNNCCFLPYDGKLLLR
jgi:hypothetical protein